MNANALARHYHKLTPEERFRLILAAGARGDEVEQDRLVNAGGRITWSAGSHAPYVQAFDALGTLFFIELVEDAARYIQAADWAADALDNFCRDSADEAEGEDAAEAEGAGTEVEAGESPAGAQAKPVWQRLLKVSYVAGYMLRTKAEGWKLFCDRLTVPAFALWKDYPGLDRLQRALAQAEKAAFKDDDLLRWLNALRPPGTPEYAEIELTVEGVTSATEAAFRQIASRWGA